ncbi:MAG: transcriptional regulator NrdR [Spirochaetales bacterium]|nr:transcriptional regulator NrdR [Spirochaetales bacterium]MCF7939414.1 transcriptional regulator NrdR [Spirochaetales bacterium]
MRCPGCGNLDDKVLESRQNSSGTVIRRRRECLACGYRFTSYERIEEKPLMIVKNDGTREIFDIGKLERGVRRALEKRPVSQQQVEELLQAVEDEAMIKGRSSREIDSRVLGELVLNRLYELDQVAYVRFASVYKRFEAVDEFRREIEHLEQH